MSLTKHFTTTGKTFNIPHSQNQNQKTHLSISDLIELVRDKPFWIRDREHHYQEGVKTDDKCCFNHLVGLLRKDGIAKPLFDYEKLLYDSLLLIPESNDNTSRHNNFKDKHLWIKKATGLGVTVHVKVDGLALSSQ